MYSILIYMLLQFTGSPAMHIQTVTLFLALVSVSKAANPGFDYVNRCNYDVWVGLLGNSIPANGKYSYSFRDLPNLMVGEISLRLEALFVWMFRWFVTFSYHHTWQVDISHVLR